MKKRKLLAALCALLFLGLSASAIELEPVFPVEDIVIAPGDYEIGDYVAITIEHNFPVEMRFEGLQVEMIISQPSGGNFVSTIRAHVVEFPFAVKAGDDFMYMLAQYPEIKESQPIPDDEEIFEYPEGD